MKTLVIYDSNGKVIFSTKNSSIEDVELNPLVVTVPEGKTLLEIDMETGDPVFVETPKSELEELKEKLAYQEEVAAELEAGIMDIAMALEQVMGGNE